MNTVYTLCPALITEMWFIKSSSTYKVQFPYKIFFHDQGVCLINCHINPRNVEECVYSGNVLKLARVGVIEITQI